MAASFELGRSLMTSYVASGVCQQLGQQPFHVLHCHPYDCPLLAVQAVILGSELKPLLAFVTPSVLSSIPSLYSN